MPRGARADSLIEIARNQLALEIGYWGYVRSGGEEEQFGWLVPVPHPVGMTNIFDEMFLDGSQASAQSDLARTVTDTWIESEASANATASGDAFASAHAVDKVTLNFAYPVSYWMSAEAESTQTSRAWVILSNMVNQTRMLYASNSSDTVSGQLAPGTFVLDAFAEANSPGSASFHYTLNVLFSPIMKMQTPAGAPIASGQAPDVGHGTDFTEAVIPGTVTNTFVVFNEGDQDLEFTDRHWFGQNPESFEILGLPETVPARSSNMFQIVFHSATRGEHEAIVFLANNSSNVPAFEVRLRGTAWRRGPPACISTNTHFTAVYQGDYPSSQTARIENQGDFTIHYDTQIQYAPTTEEWLLVEPAAGGIGGQTLFPLTVQVEHYGLDAGEYRAIVQVKAMDEELTNAPEDEARDDPDEDKVPTWMEYWSGTDPTNKVSCLGLTTPEPVAGGTESIVLRWSSLSGKWYDVQRGTNLVDVPPFVPVITNVEGLAGITTVTDRTATADSAYYYRITVAY
jgi:hypothetical protein